MGKSFIVLFIGTALAVLGRIEHIRWLWILGGGAASCALVTMLSLLDRGTIPPDHE